jgi:hypothetical protein
MAKVLSEIGRIVLRAAMEADPRSLPAAIGVGLDPGALLSYAAGGVRRFIASICYRW